MTVHDHPRRPHPVAIPEVYFIPVHSTGARAMSTALVLDADGRRDGGRWAYGEVRKTGSGQSADWRQRLNEAGAVLDHAPHLAERVTGGTLALDLDVAAPLLTPRQSVGGTHGAQDVD